MGQPGAPALHLCALGEPTAVFSRPGTQLELRTVAGSPLEWRMLLASDAAIDLIYGEFFARVEHAANSSDGEGGAAGGLTPTQAEQDQLDEFSDPLFTAKRQFVECVLKVEGAEHFQLGACSVESDEPLFVLFCLLFF